MTLTGTRQARSGESNLGILDSPSILNVKTCDRGGKTGGGRLRQERSGLKEKRRKLASRADKFFQARNRDGKSEERCHAVNAWTSGAG